jgi:TonB-dependent SusC/RagA subfamily outer membrane receptor
MLRHEAEHVVAGDPMLLLIAAAVLVLAPWNAALWFIAHRLRLAIEIDCDARVLRAVGRPREYGMLLLTVGSRHTTPLPLATSLAERRPVLERRIIAMTNARPARPILGSLPFLAIAGATAALAAQTPRPAQATRMSRSPASSASPVTAPAAAVIASSSSSETGFGTPISPAPSSAPSRSGSAASAAPASVSAAASAAAAGVDPARALDPSVATTATAPTPATATPTRALAAKATHDIPFEVIRAWIAKYYPSVMDGSAPISLVTIVVDANDRYMSSTSDDPRASAGALNTIPREQIANVEVIKGAAAAALYGPAAANGVVVVTTKDGAANSRRTPADSATAGGVGDSRRTPSDSTMPRSAGDVVRLGLLNPAIGNKPLYVVDGVVVDAPGSTTPMSAPSDLLDKLGIPADGIQTVEVLKLPGGRIGPNPLGIVVVKLKTPG